MSASAISTRQKDGIVSTCERLPAEQTGTGSAPAIHSTVSILSLCGHFAKYGIFPEGKTRGAAQEQDGIGIMPCSQLPWLSSLVLLEKMMSTEQPSQPDEPAAAMENAGFQWAYYVLFFGLLVDCIYRYKLRNEDVGDLVALAGLGVVVVAAHRIRHKPPSQSWKKFLVVHCVPQIPLADLPALLTFTLAGGLVAGCYGVVHDHLSFSIGPEYFRNFKFHQCSYADLGLGEWAFVSCVGFLGTWWVGAIGGWILARRILSTCPKKTAYRRIGAGFFVVFAAAASAGLLGYVYGLWRGPNADYSAWQPALQQYGVSDVWPFMRVAYIHNAGYIGGLVGLLLTYIAIRPGTLRNQGEDDKADGQ